METCAAGGGGRERGGAPRGLTGIRAGGLHFVDGEFGFNDLLRLLDGLLRFEHPKFTPDLLDEVERFIEGIHEHTFRIRERIAAIRAFRDGHTLG
jgi:hypothetical protein